MNYIEKWRMDELSLVLKRIGLVLQAGGQAEWAGVFHHFQEEADSLSRVPPVEKETVERLARNIQACLRNGTSLRCPLLVHEDESIGEGLFREYHRMRLRLLKILGELEECLRFVIN